MQQLKNTPITSLPALAQQIRNRIIEVIATRGGHLGASLGVVELTIALHYVFDTLVETRILHIYASVEVSVVFLNVQKVSTMLLVRDTHLPLFLLSWVWQWHQLWQAIKSDNI